MLDLGFGALFTDDTVSESIQSVTSAGIIRSSPNVAV